MTRANILLDPDIHQALRRRAFEEKKSISEIAREILREALCGNAGKPNRRRARRSPLFDIIGIAPDKPDVGARHDDYLNESKRW